MDTLKINNQRIDLTGQPFGSLTALRPTQKVLSSGRKMPAWVLVCECGTEVTAMTVNLRKGKHQSCGCKKGEKLAAAFSVNGVSSMEHNPLHAVWRQMIQRCYLPTAPNYK